MSALAQKGAERHHTAAREDDDRPFERVNSANQHGQEAHKNQDLRPRPWCLHVSCTSFASVTLQARPTPLLYTITARERDDIAITLDGE